MALVKQKKFLFVVGAVVALLLIGLNYLGPLLARFGGPERRDRVIYRWINQKQKLDWAQRWVTLYSLQSEVDDRAASTEALCVIKAHLHEDEDEMVRQLLHASLTSPKQEDRQVALSALLDVSPRYKDAALAAFLYHLNRSETSESNWIILSISVSGLAKYSFTNALPKIGRSRTTAAGTWRPQLKTR